MTKYVKAIFGNVSTSLGYFTEGTDTPVTDAVAANAEITLLQTNGYVAISNTLNDSKAVVFTPLSTLVSSHAVFSKNWNNTPAVIATMKAADAAALIADGKATLYTQVVADALATKTINDAAAVAAPADQPTLDAKAITDTVYTYLNSILTAANSAKTSADAAKVAADAAVK